MNEVVDIYPYVPRPPSVDCRVACDIYPYVPSPDTVDLSVASDIYPYVPSPTTVDVRFEITTPGEDKYPILPRPATVDARSNAVITSTPSTVGRVCDSRLLKTFIVFDIIKLT